MRPSSPYRICLLVLGTAATWALAGGAWHLGVGSARAAEDLDPMQVIADVTVIDATCRTNAIFGAVFRYGEEHGIHTVDILPLGRCRSEFQAAFDRRLAATPREDICGALQADYSHLFPAWFTGRGE